MAISEWQPEKMQVASRINSPIPKSFWFIYIEVDKVEQHENKEKKNNNKHEGDTKKLMFNIY